MGEREEGKKGEERRQGGQFENVVRTEGGKVAVGAAAAALEGEGNGGVGS